jgi:hypothetical protein
VVGEAVARTARREEMFHAIQIIERVPQSEGMKSAVANLPTKYWWKESRLCTTHGVTCKAPKHNKELLKVDYILWELENGADIPTLELLFRYHEPNRKNMLVEILEDGQMKLDYISNSETLTYVQEVWSQAQGGYIPLN